MDKILEIYNLRKEFKGFTLDDISFSIPRGFIMGFIGPNGAGKTTTIKLIMNLLHRSGGDIKIFGMDNRDHEKTIKEKIGFVYDEVFYFDRLNARQVGFLMPRFYQSWDRTAFSRYLTEFDLPIGKKIKDFSRGMKLKLSLAVALSHAAELVVMDEPTSGLDPIFRNELLRILLGYIQDENRSVLFSSHITGDLEKIADYVTFINQGKIVFSENKDDVQRQYSIVKGPKADLTPGLESRLIGLNLAGFGFEGLCRNVAEIRMQLPGQAVVETADLDQIMLFFAREARLDH